MLTKREFEDYLRYFGSSRESTFSELLDRFGLSKPMLKYELHRLKRACCVYSPSRGRYRFVDPSIWAGVARASERFPRLLELAELYSQDGILGIYLYGSWARGEASRSSDYDLFIVVRDHSCVKGPTQKLSGVDVRMLGLNDVVALIKRDPVQIVPILRESIPVYGGGLMEYLKSLGFDKERLLGSLHEALASITLAGDMIEAGKDGEVDSTLLYPLMLRFRQYCLVRSILEGIPGTLKQAEKISGERGLNGEEFRELYEVFRSEQRGVQSKIKKAKLLRFLRIVRGLVESCVEKHRPRKIKTRRLRRLEKLREEFQEVLRATKEAAAEGHRFA